MMSISENMLMPAWRNMNMGSLFHQKNGSSLGIHRGELPVTEDAGSSICPGRQSIDQQCIHHGSGFLNEGDEKSPCFHRLMMVNDG